jgi:hypothetical protein
MSVLVSGKLLLAKWVGHGPHHHQHVSFPVPVVAITDSKPRTELVISPSKGAVRLLRGRKEWIRAPDLRLIKELSSLLFISLWESLLRMGLTRALRKPILRGGSHLTLI